jgi:hypothetical protein
VTELEEINFVAIFKLLKSAIEDNLAKEFPWDTLVFHQALDTNN